jgi:hypothetical protein
VGDLAIGDDLRRGDATPQLAEKTSLEELSESDQVGIPLPLVAYALKTPVVQLVQRPQRDLGVEVLQNLVIAEGGWAKFGVARKGADHTAAEWPAFTWQMQRLLSFERRDG